MYLVTAAADDLGPGSTVAVEPVFITDGDEILLAYDYCATVRRRAAGQVVWIEYRRWIEKLRLGAIADDVSMIDVWCTNQEVETRSGPFYGRDNEGALIEVSSLTMSADKFRSGKGIVTRIEERGAPSEVLAEHRRYRFFLLGRNAALVKRVLPQWDIPDDDTARRLAHLLPHNKERIQGVISPGCVLRGCTAREKEILTDQGAPQGFAERGSVFLPFPLEPISATFADIDDDGLMEFLVGMRSINRTKTSEEPGVWQGMAILGLRRPLWVHAIVYSFTRTDTEAETVFAYKAFASLPMLVLRTASCRYLLTTRDSGFPFGQTMHLRPLPESTEQCQHRASNVKDGEGGP